MGQHKRALRRRMRDSLRLLRSQLLLVHAGILVAAAALRGQNADQDREIADVLRHCVGDRLARQIERTTELIALLHDNDTAPLDPDGPRG